MYSGKIAVPPGGGGIRIVEMASLVNVTFPIENMDTPEFIEALNNAGGVLLVLVYLVNMKVLTPFNFDQDKLSKKHPQVFKILTATKFQLAILTDIAKSAHQSLSIICACALSSLKQFQIDDDYMMIASDIMNEHIAPLKSDSIFIPLSKKCSTRNVSILGELTLHSNESKTANNLILEISGQLATAKIHDPHPISPMTSKIPPSPAETTDLARLVKPTMKLPKSIATKTASHSQEILQDPLKFPSEKDTSILDTSDVTQTTYHPVANEETSLKKFHLRKPDPKLVARKPDYITDNTLLSSIKPNDYSWYIRVLASQFPDEIKRVILATASGADLSHLFQSFPQFFGHGKPYQVLISGQMNLKIPSFGISEYGVDKGSIRTH
jgi:hypothetical protein